MYQLLFKAILIRKKQITEKFYLPNTKSITVRRQIFHRILRFDTFFERSDRCERTIETPIIHVNQGKTRSANVKPFQAINKYQYKNSKIQIIIFLFHLLE